MSAEKLIRMFGTRKWEETCPAGEPVPDEAVCSALNCESQPLTALKVGESARITCLDTVHGRVAAKLAAMGILPGTRITLVRRSPVFVFRIDYAEFAIDAELAGLIRVQI